MASLAPAATPRVILTDIEGTTSSIAFVHEVLFPYARKHLPAFLRAHAEAPEVRAEIQAVAMEARCNPGDLSIITATLLSWMDADRKVTPLKALQGMIWKAGYAEGALQGHIYPDAAEGLRRWHAAGIRLAVYSSGSVPAQKLIFGHSEAGDLRSLFSGWFDTRVGGKREAASYARIATELNDDPADILFLSDIAEELDAAAEAGLRTTQLVRAADGTVASPRHPRAAAFADLSFD